MIIIVPNAAIGTGPNVSKINTNYKNVGGIFIKDNKVLLARVRGYSNTFLPGGHIEFGESAKDALKREIEEELGVSCAVGSFLGVVEHKWRDAL